VNLPRDKLGMRSIIVVAMIVVGGGTASFSPAPTSTGHGSSAACDGLRAHLLSYFERAGRVWNSDPWAYSEGDEVSWKSEQVQSLPAGLRSHAPFLREAVPNWGTEAEECSLTVWRKFYVDGDTIAFTMGRAPEYCSEAPRMIWTDPRGRQRRRIIPPLFNRNVEALWCTEHYLVFGLAANYEYGEQDERLAFWHLGDGRLVLSPGLVWEDSGRVARREPSLPERLPGWREASVAEMGGAFVFTKRDTVLALWPGRRTYFSSLRR
jgi:hypothetical protein